MTRPLSLLAIVAGLAISRAAAAGGLLIIANPSVSVPTPMPLSEIAAIYLLRVTTWPDGSNIVPVNREATSETRVEFTARVLHQDNAELATYWGEMHYMGKLPPVVQESTQAMLAFVRNVPGAVGYIRATTPPAGVRVLADVP